METGRQSVEERTLVQAFLRSRSERAFRHLYRAQTPGMLRLARRLTSGSSASAEDVVQEAWSRAVPALQLFEWRSSLKSWLAGYVANIVREYRRSARVTASQVSPPIELEWTDPLVMIEVAAALEQLPPGFRAVLTLHDMAGLTHEEIATALKIQPGTSKSQLARARNRLREILYPREED